MPELKSLRLEEFLQFLSIPDIWIEIRLIGNGKSIPRFYRGVKELMNDFSFLKSQNENNFNVYYGILPRKTKPESGGGSKEHVVDRADKLWLDVDVFSVKKPEEYENLTDEEIKARVLEKYEEAKKILEGKGIRISACVYSGRGFQPIIKLNQEITKEEIEELNKALVQFLRNHGFKVDNAWDCARVLRLPGFYNVKDDRKLLAELIELNDNVIDVEVVRKLKEKLEEKEKEKKKPKPETETNIFVNDLGIHLNAIRRIDKKLDELLEVIEHPEYPSPSEADMACASRLYYWRFNESQIVEILRTHRYREKLDRDDYIELTLSKIEGDKFNPVENPKLFLKLSKITEDLNKDTMSRVGEEYSQKGDRRLEKHKNFDENVNHVRDVRVFPNFKSSRFLYSVIKVKENLDNPDTPDTNTYSQPDSLSFCEQKEETLDMEVDLKDLFFDENGKFIAKRLADEIMSQVQFVTLVDTEEVWYYSDGIFKPGGEAIIKALCQEYLGEKANTHRVNEVIGHIQRSTYIERSEFDKNINLIAVENGVLNLETGELVPHSPDYFPTVKIPVVYDPEADCPKVKKFLSEVLHPDDIPVIEEFFGFCLWRKYFIHKAFMLVGEGSNGKTTLIKLLENFLGKQNVSSVSIQDLGENRFAAAELYGKLANLFADIPDRALRNTGIFKMLTGGDTLTVERKFKNPFKFENYAKQIYSCNKLPETYDETDAFFRRWIIINFPNKFEGDKADKTLIEKLTTPEELSGLLNLALEGLNRLLEKGEFSKGVSTEEVREAYIRMSNPVAAFVMDCIEIDPEGYIPKKELYSNFCEYCRKNKLPTVSENTFHKKLGRQVKVEDYRPKIAGKRITAWRGIRWKVENEENGKVEYFQEETYDLTEYIEDETPDQETLIREIKEAVRPAIEKYKKEQEPEGYPRTQIEINILSIILRKFPSVNSEKVRFYIKRLKEEGEIIL
jgi:putative DNA primase/helicase